jgi:acyl carrier protein
VVSGKEEFVDSLKKTLIDKGISCSKLHTSHAFHSELMNEAVGEFEKFIKAIKLNKPSKAFISNISGDFITDDQATSVEYWSYHIRQPVKFSQGIESLNNRYKEAIYLEVGPGNSLSSFVKQHKIYDEENIEAITSIPSAKEFNQTKADDLKSFYSAIGRVWSGGYDIDWSSIWKTNIEELRNVVLPGYQFERNKCWIDLPIMDTRQVSNKEDIKIIINQDKIDVSQDVASKILIENDGTDLERQIAEIFSEVLGNKKISKHKSFFDLGGTSLSVISLIDKLNNRLGANLPISTIFKQDSVYKLASLLSYNNDYKTIVKLNNTKDKPNLFMIHPGLAGCEVYVSIAKLLEDKFSCFGVDSYNLYNADKIMDLHELAKYYLDKIDEIMSTTSQKLYNLFGWSLGGLIALEIASILEKRGNTKIRVYLLDSIIDDDRLFKSKYDNKYLKPLKNDYTQYLIGQGYDKNLAEKRCAIIDISMSLSKNWIPTKLNHTHIVLFKAMLKNPNYTNDYLNKIQEYSLKLKYNNVEQIVKNKNYLELINVHNAHHDNMLEQEDLLISKVK